MKNRSALETVAILSSLIKYEQRDYQDLICPFVIDTLPQKENVCIDYESVKNELHENFGIKIPTKCITKLINKISRKYRGHIKKRNNKHYIIKPIINNDFTEQKRTMKKQISKVVNAFMVYYNSTNINGSIDFEKARTKIIAFYNKYGYCINDKGINELYDITQIRGDIYKVAKFILIHRDKDDEVYDSILEITKGFFAHKAIYYFVTDKKKTIESKLKNTLVMVDTSIIIDMLGYNKPEDKISGLEFKSLVEKNGGRLVTFPHYVEEIKTILTAFARDTSTDYRKRLDTLRSSDYDEVDITRLIFKFKSQITSFRDGLGIDILPYSNVKISELHNSDVINLSKLDRLMRNKYIEMGKVPPKDHIIENDVNSLCEVNKHRRGRSVDTYEESKAIFVTDNPIILALSKEIVKGIPYAISSIDLTSILWLNSYSEITSIPESRLIENAFAACSPSNKLMNTVFEKVENLKKQGKITEDDAFLVRSLESQQNRIVDLTSNDYHNVKEDVILETIKNYKADIRYEFEKSQKNKISKIKLKKKIEAREKANSIKNKIINILKLLSRILFITITCVLLISIVYDYIITNNYKVYKLILFIFSILSTIDTTITTRGKSIQIINTVAEKVYDLIYTKEKNKIDKIYNEIM